MLRFIARRYAKAAYVFRQEVEASTNELNAGLALRTAAEKHKLAAQLTEQADQMDARIKEMDTNLDTGFWECENGHELQTAQLGPVADDFKECPECAKKPGTPPLCTDCIERRQPHLCAECQAPVKLIKRDQMTGQEKYESDRERKDAEDLSKAKRDQATAEEDNATQSEKAAKYLQALATNIRNTTEKIRKL